LASLFACDASDGGGATCGDGTELRDGACVAVDDDANNAQPNNAQPNNANNPGLTCGAGTVDDGAGNCAPSDPTVCGPGTTRNEQGECVAEPGLACGEGTVDDGAGNCVSAVEPGLDCGPGTVDGGAGACVPAEGLCPTGTLLVEGQCELIDPTTTATLMDDEPNDPEAGGAPMRLELLPEGEPLVFWGNVDQPVTLADATELPDLDVFQIVAEPGTRVRVEATALVPGASLGAAIPNFVAMQLRSKRSEVTPSLGPVRNYDSEEFVVPAQEDAPRLEGPLAELLGTYGG
jgi:hypothetical protein